MVAKAETLSHAYADHYSIIQHIYPKGELKNAVKYIPNLVQIKYILKFSF